jgi:hypothetical protein
MILVDTNVLLRLIQIGHPHQQPAVDAVALLRVRDREQLVICAQTLYEMYAVSPNFASLAQADLTLLQKNSWNLRLACERISMPVKSGFPQLASYWPPKTAPGGAARPQIGSKPSGTVAPRCRTLATAEITANGRLRIAECLQLT